MAEKNVKAIPEGYSNVIPYLACIDTDKVIEFLQKTFGAAIDEVSRRDDGKVMHASIHIRDSSIMFSEANEMCPHAPSSLYIYVENVDEIYQKGIEAGGISLREPTNEFYGDRSSGLKDVSGNQWWIATHIEDVSPEELAKRQKAAKK